MRTLFSLLILTAILTVRSSAANVLTVNAPQLVVPSNDTIMPPGSRNVQFRWTRVHGATDIQYFVELSATNTFAKVFALPGVSDTQYLAPAVPLAPGDGFWRVRVVADGNTIYSNPPFFHITIGSPVQKTPVTFFAMTDGQQALYDTTEQIPVVISIGLWHQKGIKRVTAPTEIHRDTNKFSSYTMTLSPTGDAMDRAGQRWAGVWRSPVPMQPNDTLKYSFVVTDSTDQITKLDSAIFRVVVKGASRTSTVTYPWALAPTNQYKFELVDTAGYEIDSTRKRLRADNAAKGMIHRFETYCGPVAAAAFGDNVPDTTAVDGFAALCLTNNPLDGTAPGDLVNAGHRAAPTTRRWDIYLDTLNVMRLPVLDTTVTYHRGAPHFADAVRALKDTNLVLLGLGWWSDSGGARWKRRGGHFLTSGFRPDMHWVAVAALNENTHNVTIMDPDCGCMRTMRWGASGTFANVMDSANAPNLAVGMTSLIECMIAGKRLYPEQQGVNDGVQPGGAMLVAAYPNPFTGSTTVTVAGEDLRGARMTVRDMLGRVVASAQVEPDAAAGDARMLFDGRGLAAGMYAITVSAGTRVVTSRVMLTR